MAKDGNEEEEEVDPTLGVPVEGEGPVIEFERVLVQVGKQSKPIITKVVKFPADIPVASVNIRIGKKKQLTQFEPVEASVSITRPCVNSDKAIEFTYQHATKMALHILDDVMKQVIKWDAKGVEMTL